MERREANPAAHNIHSLLFNFNFGPGIFQFFLGGVGIGLVGAFQHRLGRAFHQGFGIGQTQARFDFAHRLDGRDLLVRRDGGQDDVKARLRFRGGGGGASAGGGGRRPRQARRR